MDLPTALVLEVIALAALIPLCDLAVRGVDAVYGRLARRRAAKRGDRGA